MTELERQLLSAFERLESDWKAEQEASKKAFSALHVQYKQITQENAELRAELSALRQLVEDFSAQLRRL